MEKIQSLNPNNFETPQKAKIWKIFFVINITLTQVVLFFLGLYFWVDSTLLDDKYAGIFKWLPLFFIVVILPFCFLRFAKKRTGTYLILLLNIIISILTIILVCKFLFCTYC